MTPGNNNKRTPLQEELSLEDRQKALENTMTHMFERFSNMQKDVQALTRMMSEIEKVIWKHSAEMRSEGRWPE